MVVCNRLLCPACLAGHIDGEKDKSFTEVPLYFSSSLLHHFHDLSRPISLPLEHFLSGVPSISLEASPPLKLLPLLWNRNL